MEQNLKGVYVMHNNSEITKVEQLLKDSDITKPLVNYVHIAFMLGYEKAKGKFEREQGHWIELEPDKYNNFIQCSVCGGKFGLYSKDNYCQACGAIMEEKKGDVSND